MNKKEIKKQYLKKNLFNKKEDHNEGIEEDKKDK